MLLIICSPDGYYLADVKFGDIQAKIGVASPECYQPIQTRSRELSSGICVACPEHCLQCKSLTQCLRCAPGFYEQTINFGDVPDTRFKKNAKPNYGIACVKECRSGYYAEIDNNDGAGICRDCDKACETCKAAGPAGCTMCRFRVQEQSDPMHVDETKPIWSCVSYCPTDKPVNQRNCSSYNSTEIEEPVEMKQCVSTETDILSFNQSLPTLQGQCIAQEMPRASRAIVIGVSIAVAVVIIIVITILVVVYQLRRRARDKKATMEFQVQLEPQDPTGTRVDSMASSGNNKPNMASLRLISESNLKRGMVLGRGAFGTVYAGIWQAEPGVKVPVALKVLKRRYPDSNGKDSRPNSQEGPSAIDELIAETKIMCSVCHPSCVRVVGLCLGSEDVVLVTQMMQKGSLLGVLLEEKRRVEEEGLERQFGAWHLLTWGKQIAEGMNYLESKGIIHRDLAARNVLVRTLTQVRITDFGLAKLLEGQSRVYRPATGGTGERLPFKWLSIESLLQRVFTHKSDVWSFGVTLWELFTFGEPPYGAGITPDALVQMLLDGGRLPQPSVASIDAYTWMIRCWLRDADERPPFSELAEQFKKMSGDPGHYLAIPGDTHFRGTDGQAPLPPSPNELLADLGIVSSPTTNSSNFSPEINSGRSSQVPLVGPGHQSRVVEADDYLPNDYASSRGSRATLRNSSRARASQPPRGSSRLAEDPSSGRNNGYTIDPTTSTVSPSQTRVSLRPGTSYRPQTFIPPIDVSEQDDYMTPSNSASSPRPPSSVPSVGIISNPGQHRPQSYQPATQWPSNTGTRQSQQPSALSPTSRETII